MPNKVNFLEIVLPLKWKANAIMLF
jgi:hypothetical protein